MKHGKIFDLLRTIAADVSPVAHARIAAAVVYRKDIIALGACQKQTHPLQKQFSRNPESIYLHAEIDAIKNVLKRYSPRVLKSSTLIVVRQKWADSNKTKLVDGLACPCDGCQRAIDYYQIPNVEWSTDHE